MLTVLERVENDRFGHVNYRCKCDCGGESIVDATNLRGGSTKSCGCIKSRGEHAINTWLTKHNIPFIQNHSVDEIVYSSGRHPMFDFAIFDKCGQIKFLIEYNGVQHYQSGYGWNDDKCHGDTVRRDKEKMRLCNKFGYDLAIIPYSQIDDIDSVLDKFARLYKIGEYSQE